MSESSSRHEIGSVYSMGIKKLWGRCWSFSRNDRDGVDLEQQLRPRERDHLDHRAGWEVRSQDLAPHFIDISVVAHVGGEDVQRDDVVHRSARGFDGALNLAQDETRLSPCITGADNFAVAIRSRLAGDEYHPSRLRD